MLALREYRIKWHNSKQIRSKIVRIFSEFARTLIMTNSFLINLTYLLTLIICGHSVLETEIAVYNAQVHSTHDSDEGYNFVNLYL